MIETAEQRPIPGKEGYQATIDGKIIAMERLVTVGRHRQSRGGRSHVFKRYVKRRQQRIVRAHRGRVRLRTKAGLQAVPVWRLVVLAFICRLRETDRVSYIDGDSENCHASNLRVVRASGKTVTLADRRDA